MAEFMNLGLDNEQKDRRDKGNYVSPLEEFCLLSQNVRDRELIRRFRFSENGIRIICDTVANDLKPGHGMKGNPVPVDIQVFY